MTGFALHAMLSALYPRMVALFSVHALLIVYHTTSFHSQITRLTAPTLCTVCMHLQCFFIQKNAQNGFDPSYDYATLFVCTYSLLQTKNKLKNSNKINKNSLKMKVGGRYSTAKIGFWDCFFPSFPCFYTHPRDHTPMKSLR